jgi:hypothetical protein
VRVVASIVVVGVLGKTEHGRLRASREGTEGPKGAAAMGDDVRPARETRPTFCGSWAKVWHGQLGDLGSGFWFFQTCPDPISSYPHPISDPSLGRSRHLPPSRPGLPLHFNPRFIQKRGGSAVFATNTLVFLPEKAHPTK